MIRFLKDKRRRWRMVRRSSSPNKRPIHSAVNVFAADHLFPDDWWQPGADQWKVWLWTKTTDVTEWLEGNWPWCNHYIENDQCGKPEHRYCVWCMKQQPNAPLS